MHRTKAKYIVGTSESSCQYNSEIPEIIVLSLVKDERTIIKELLFASNKFFSAECSYSQSST